MVRVYGLTNLIDQVISVDELGIYKPDPRVYQLALDGFGVTKNQVLFHSSNAWDVAGVVNFGFNVPGLTASATRAFV